MNQNQTPAAPGGPITGPVSVAAHDFFLVDSRPVPKPDLSKPISKPKQTWDDEPYVYSGPVSSQRPSPAWLATGAAVIGAAVVVVLMASDLSASEDARKKVETELATVSATATAQAQQITAFEAARTKSVQELVAKDQVEQQAKAKALALRDTLALAVPNEVSTGDVTVTPDGHNVRVELRDKLLFDSDGTTLTEEGRAALVALGAVLKKGEGSIDVVGHSEARRMRAKDPPSEGTWGTSAVRATVVLRALEEDARVSSRRLSAIGKGATEPLKGKQKTRRVELVISPT